MNRDEIKPVGPRPDGLFEDPSLPDRVDCERCGRSIHPIQAVDFEGGYDNACVHCTDGQRLSEGKWVPYKGTMHD